MNILVCTICIAVLVFISMTSPIGFVNAQSSERINWGEICRSTLVDALITEPCNALTSSDGYTLTPQGQRVLACIAGGGLLLLADPTGETLIVAQQTLGPAAGCGGSASMSAVSQSASGNYLSGGLIQILQGK